jgi:hypothetical protein
MAFAPGKFRHRAIERVSSPEQLDQLLRITAPRRWIALVALLVLVAVAIAWSLIATVPTTVTGPGYLLPQGGLRQIQAPVPGVVTAINMQDGQHVLVQQKLGTIVDSQGRTNPILAPETGVVTETDSVLNLYVSPGDRVGLVQPVGFPLVIYGYVPTDIAATLRPGTEARVRFASGIGQAFGYAEGAVESVSQFSVTQQRLSFILQDSAVVANVMKLGPTNEVVIALNQSATTPSGLVWGSGHGPPGQLPAGLPATVTFVLGEHHPVDNAF